MRKLIEASLVSLDGIVESPWEWTGSHFGEGSKRRALEVLGKADTFLLGRVTYDKFVATWPHIKGEAYFDRINAMPKLIASTTLRNPTWNASVIEGDVATTLAELKRRPGGTIVKYGSGRLTRTLVEHGLIDEFHLSVIPVVVGGGTRLFQSVDPERLNLELVNMEPIEHGVVSLTYVPR